MNPKREDIIEKVKHWVEIAEEDLHLAKFALTMTSNVPYRLIAFHAQQSAEKYIKALLVYYRIDFPYTHDIAKLLSLCPKELELFKKLEKAGDLTDYAVSKRYPDYYDKLSKKVTVDAIELAELVKQTINDHLVKEGLSFS